MRKAVYFCPERSWTRVYGPEQQATISEMVDVYEHLVTPTNWKNHLTALAEAEIIISTWGGARMTTELLGKMPKLKAYFYGAGDITKIVSDAAWERGIRISTANDANAISVAEFVLSQIIFSLKRGWEYMQLAKADNPQLWGINKLVPGMYRSNVGIVSLGQISIRLCRLLKEFDLNIFAYSSNPAPILEEEPNLNLVSLPTLFESCDVITLHLRMDESSRGAINYDLLRRMKKNATLINTARGGVINQLDLIRFLKERTDVYACVDVTDPEPPAPDCELLRLNNVVLTPHLAGSMNRESYRMGLYVASEIRRYLNGKPMQGEVTQEVFNQKSLAVDPHTYSEV